MPCRALAFLCAYGRARVGVEKKKGVVQRVKLTACVERGIAARHTLPGFWDTPSHANKHIAKLVLAARQAFRDQEKKKAAHTRTHTHKNAGWAR